MSEPIHHEPSIRAHSIRDYSVRDPSVHHDYHSAHGGHGSRDGRSRGHPDYASRDGYDRDYAREEVYPHEHITLVHDSPRQSHISGTRDYNHVPYSNGGGTVIHEIHEARSVSGRSGRSARSPGSRKNEVEVNLKPGEKQVRTAAIVGYVCAYNMFMSIPGICNWAQYSTDCP